MEDKTDNVKLGELKECPVRIGRFYDGKIFVIFIHFSSLLIYGLEKLLIIPRPEVFHR